MDSQKILNSAKNTVREAVILDNGGNFTEAYAKYMSALDKFMLVLKYEKNVTIQNELRKHIEQYMNRAEVLKQEIILAKQKPVGVSTKAADKTKHGNMLSEAILTEKPNVAWDDVAGLSRAKDLLKEAVILPRRQPQLFLDGEPWRGILLYGPPGTGKSFLAKALATEADSTFFSVSSADLVSKWQGESEKLIKALFQRAREEKPSIIFIDEVDSMCGKRSEGDNDASGRIKTQFLIQMDGVGTDASDVLVLGATNLPWSLDIAMRRRFEKRVYIPLPESEAISKLFKLKLEKTKHTITDQQFESLGPLTRGYSGADIAVIAREAIMMPIRKLNRATHFRTTEEGMYVPCKASEEGALKMSLYEVPIKKALKDQMTYQDLQQALQVSNPSVKREEINSYIDWTNNFGETA